MKKEIIRLKNISKKYFLSKTQTVEALKDANLVVKEGEFISIVGSSGSGKSTLMNIIGFLDIPTSGEYYYKDMKLENLSENELTSLRIEDIGFIFQSFNLLPSKNVYENVKLPLIYSKKKKGLKDYVTSALKKANLDESLWYKKPNQLSGGQKQRVAIARALVNKPKIILADEPTGNLDSKTGQKVLLEMQKLNKEDNVTIIMITHDNNIAKSADRIVVIKDGDVLEK